MTIIIQTNYIHEKKKGEHEPSSVRAPLLSTLHQVLFTIRMTLASHSFNSTFGNKFCPGSAPGLWLIFHNLFFNQTLAAVVSASFSTVFFSTVRTTIFLLGGESSSSKAFVEGPSIGATSTVSTGFFTVLHSPSFGSAVVLCIERFKFRLVARVITGLI